MPNNTEGNDPDISSNSITGVSTLHIESSDERSARIARENEDAKYSRYRTMALFIAGLIIVVVLISMSVYILLSTRFTSELQDWAKSIIVLAFGNILGYLIGKKID